MTKIILHIGNSNIPKMLNDNQHPELALKEIKTLLLDGIEVFTSNSNLILSYLTCLLKASKIGYSDCEKYPIKIDELLVYTWDVNKTMMLLGDYNGIPEDNNIVNNAIVNQNNEFGDLLDYEDSHKIK
jgi:hypothetical protein